MALNNKKYNSDEFIDGDRPLRLQHRFLVLRKLGQGTYGKVQLALNKETNEEVAVKTIKKAKIENAEDMLRIRREIHIMTALRHPHIIHINEVFETRQKIVIVMQYASGGELYDYLGCHQILPEEEARRIFRQISSAIYYCHMNQICHRDLKLENILLDEEGNARIADFGLSNIFDDKRRMNTFCGSPLYASPEIVKGTPYKGPEVDCWSLGVLLYTLVYGTMPFDGRSFKELVSQISEGRYEEPINRSNASSLIRRLLTPDIARRATIKDVCKDSWVNQGYNTSLLEVAENMALMAGLPPREQISATKLSLETNTKNGREKSIFRKAAAQLEEKAGKFTSLFTKNRESITKTNDVNSDSRKSILYDQITNYDVRFVLNKLIAAVEASLNADKNSRNLTTMNGNIATIRNSNRKESVSEKVDSAYVIPIFDVTSVIPNERVENTKIMNEKLEKATMMSTISNDILVASVSGNENCNQSVHIKMSSKDGTKKQNSSENKNNSMQTPDIQHKNILVDGCHRSQILTDSQKQFYSLNISGQPDAHKIDFQTRKLQHDHPLLRQPSPKTKRLNDGFPLSHKNLGPFTRTKHHVLSLARLLSLNYEKLMRNSFRMQPCKKKLPGKITIPPTFDPNNPPTATKKQQEDKKELLIFPTVSVSENKEKIEKKIDKIKKAALNKNIIIRSDSKTRMRIEKYIRSQVKKIQDLVCEDQRSIHASLEHLDEQSFRDMSEMYYRAFGSENTDSGIANTEEEEYFCFLCSKPNGVKGTAGFVDSFVLESIKKGCSYKSNHLHIPKAKEQNRWGYATNNGEFGSLSKCKSEIEFPVEYLNYISSNNKSDLNKRTHHKQQIQRSNIGNTKCFSTIQSTIKPDGSNLRILRSASDSVGLNLSKNTFEVLKLNTDGNDDILQNYSLFPHFLEQTSFNGCNYSQMTDYDIQSTATDATFINTSHMLDKDDGIGDSNDSFQSYIETFENNIVNDIEEPHLACSYSYTNFTKENFNNQRPSTKMPSEPHLKHKYEDEIDKFGRRNCEREEILDATSWATNLDKKNGLTKEGDKNGGLRRRNTMTCVRGSNEMDENFRLDQTSTEFENYLWNAYKEHLLDDSLSDAEFSSSPNLNYYSLDRRTKCKSRAFKSMDINGERSNDFVTKLLSNTTLPSEQDSNTTSSITLQNILKNSNVTKNMPERSASRLSRTKSICSEILQDSDRDDIIRKIRAERKASQGNNALDGSNGNRSPFMSNFLNDLEKREHGRKVDDSNRRRYSKNNLLLSKRNKSEYKKSFLQLLALKRIQEAEKELDKSPRSELLNVEEENSGSLLEALKTHGYKTVISQRFQDTGDDDYLDPFHMKHLKSPRNLRAELARLNYMYYESLPKYTLEPYDENDYLYDDLDYTRSMLNGLSTQSFYDTPIDYRQQMPKQFVYDWLDTAQIDEYLNTLRSDLLYNPEETVTLDTRRCCSQWGRENYRHLDDESNPGLHDTVEEIPSGAFNAYSKIKELNISNETTHAVNNDGSQMHSNTDDERRESVQDRIWRKSFYSRFNNRALSRKRSSIIEPELSESRLGLLNDLYNNPLKSGFEKSEYLQRDGSNKSFHMKRSKNHSPSIDKFESRNSMRKKYAKSSKERETMLNNEASSSNKEFINVYNREPENEELKPEH